MHKLFKIPMLPSSNNNNNNQSPQSRLQQIPTSNNNNNSPQLSILTPDNQYLNSKISPLSSCSLTLR